MIERLQRALERIEGLPEPVQDKVAELLERFAVSYEMRVATARDLPDDAGEPLRRWQHESIPTLPLDEHLAWLDMGPDE